MRDSTGRQRATIVRQEHQSSKGRFFLYHIRVTPVTKPPQTGGDVTIIDTLEQRTDETGDAFIERATRFVNELPDE